MRRREFITLIGEGALWRRGRSARVPNSLRCRSLVYLLPVIGILNDSSSDWVGAFRQGLKEGGLIEGRVGATRRNFSNGVSRRDGTASLDAPRSQVPAFPRQD
jgi:hypothetical protein